MSEEHLNWIEGCDAPAASGLTFDLGSRLEPARVLGRWPSSGTEDLGLALAAAGGCGLLGPEVAGRLAEALPATEDLSTLLADLLGLDPVLETAPLEARFDPAEEARAPRDAPGEPRGAALVLAHWSELSRGLARRVVRHLAAGRAVVVLSDRRLPAAADRLALAARDADLPPGALGVIHGKADELLADALAGGVPAGLACLDALCGPERLSALEGLWSGAETTVLIGEQVRCRTVAVGLEDDLERAAEEVVENAFGRSSTLSGQLPGQVARVACHQLRFSRFTEELLARLDESLDAGRPVPPIDARAAERVRRIWSLGLDEGAAIVSGGELSDPRSDARDGPDRPATALPPTVFTNVEAGLRLARLRRPAAVLSLLRATSDEAALDLVRRLDGEPAPRVAPSSPKPVSATPGIRSEP